MDILNYFQYNSILILSFFLISLAELILNKLTAGNVDKYLFSSQRGSPFNILTYVRLFTHIFGHSNWKHFAGNFIYILLVGPMIEEKYGFWELLIMILITAFVVGLANIITSKNRLRGASCIVFMFIVMSSFVNIENGKIPITLVLIFLFYIVDEIIDWFSKKNDNVSHMGHLLGALCGLAFGFMYMNGYTFLGLIDQFFS